MPSFSVTWSISVALLLLWCTDVRSQHSRLGFPANWSRLLFDFWRGGNFAIVGKSQSIPQRGNLPVIRPTHENCPRVRWNLFCWRTHTLYNTGKEAAPVKAIMKVCDTTTYWGRESHERGNEPFWSFAIPRLEPSSVVTITDPTTIKDQVFTHDILQIEHSIPKDRRIRHFNIKD